MNISDFSEQKFIKNDTCLACGSGNIEQILDFGRQPLANSYHDASNELDEYPLNLNLCKDCYHLQLGEIVNPDLMFRDYLYVSGTTKTLKDYFDWFSSWSIDQLSKFKKVDFGNFRVLDIACNDGSQLDSYKSMGCSTYGIDPAENLFNTSSSKGHDAIFLDYFPSKSLDGMKFDIIVAQNVFAHNLNPLEFLISCKEIMEEGSLLFIQTSQANMVQNGEFDTIYHEHISFFNPTSMMELVERSGLQLHDIIYTGVHGSSYVFIIRKPSFEPVGQGFIDVFEETRQAGLFEVNTYLEYANRTAKTLEDFSNCMEDLRSKGYLLVGYGAAAKGNTLLNAAKVKLDYIVDDNPLKQGMYTPGMNIPIHSPDVIKDIGQQNVAFIPLAWNFFPEIKEKILSRRNQTGDVFVSYFPSVNVF